MFCSLEKKYISRIKKKDCISVSWTNEVNFQAIAALAAETKIFFIESSNILFLQNKFYWNIHLVVATALTSLIRKL